MSLLTSDKIDIIAPLVVKALENPPELRRSTEAQAGTRKYLYVPLDEALELLRPHFAQYGIAILQPTRESITSGTIHVSTVLLHVSGQFIGSDGLTLPLAKSDPQGAGSAVTYARRYDLLSLLGLAQEDDDGQAASAPAQTGRAVAPTATALPVPQPAASPAVTGDKWVGAVVELVEMQDRSGEAALAWASAHNDPPKAIMRTLADAKGSGLPVEAVGPVLEKYDLSAFIEAFNAIEIK